MSKYVLFSLIFIILFVGLSCPADNKPITSLSADDSRIEVVDKPDTKAKNDFYISNRPPLLPSPLIKLSIGAIEPHGWVRRQLIVLIAWKPSVLRLQGLNQMESFTEPLTSWEVAELSAVF